MDVPPPKGMEDKVPGAWAGTEVWGEGSQSSVWAVGWTLIRN